MLAAPRSGVGLNELLGGVPPKEIEVEYQEFQALKPSLTEQLAAVIAAKLVEMGDDVKGVSWFSSAAEQHPKNAT